ADLLVQECALQRGSRDPRTATHCSPEDAGEVAAQAGVKELLLVHYPDTMARDPEAALARVRKYFAGPARLARDGEVIAL
ncbi:MAG: MBL fold metallo-hydrolase, partial [Chloroflexi bacterium]|nr:MBL fold metallo-hydrolase [Chloroflexota bacterium]